MYSVPLYFLLLLTAACGFNLSSSGARVGAIAGSVIEICPTNYILVPANPSVKTYEDFCVSKYEIRNVAGVPSSQPDGTIWISITLADARTACESKGTSYNLMTNPEWMTLARNVESVDENWSSSVAGSGTLARGHSDAAPANLIDASTNDSDGYVNTLNTGSELANAGWEQRRTLYLDNGEVIWDLAGNANEMIDWVLTPATKAFSSVDGSPQNAYIDFNTVDSNISSGQEMEVDTWEPYFSTLDGTNGIGRYFAGSSVVTGGLAIRGGQRGLEQNAGIYTLRLNNSVGSTGASIGFRCVFHP